MSLTAIERGRMCERQLDRLSDADLERHDLLNVATILMLLIASVDPDAVGDVEGHEFNHAHCAESHRLADLHSELDWVRSYGEDADIDDVRIRTRRAAEELAHHLRESPTGGATS